MNLVSVDHLSFHLSGKAGSLAGDEVLLLLAHQPVVHRALSGSCDVISQPALVPFVKVFVLTRCHFVLRLQGEENNQRLGKDLMSRKQTAGSFVRLDMN